MEGQNVSNLNDIIWKAPLVEYACMPNMQSTSFTGLHVLQNEKQDDRQKKRTNNKTGGTKNMCQMSFDSEYKNAKLHTIIVFLKKANINRDFY